MPYSTAITAVPEAATPRRKYAAAAPATADQTQNIASAKAHCRQYSSCRHSQETVPTLEDCGPSSMSKDQRTIHINSEDRGIIHSAANADRVETIAEAVTI
eukprot:g35680.t1